MVYVKNLLLDMSKRNHFVGNNELLLEKLLRITVVNFLSPTIDLK